MITKSSIPSSPSIHTLESLVPSLDLCKQIPEGAFTNSVFVWSYSCDKRKTEAFVDERDCIEFCRRDMVNAPPVYSAPTLQEILLADPTIGVFRYNQNEWMAEFLSKQCGPIWAYDSSPSTAALKLWLELNPPEVKP